MGYGTTRAGLGTATLDRRTVDVRGREAGLDVYAEQVTIPQAVRP
jgi:hypothetical protein